MASVLCLHSMMHKPVHEGWGGGGGGAGSQGVVIFYKKRRSKSIIKFDSSAPCGYKNQKALEGDSRMPKKSSR